MRISTTAALLKQNAHPTNQQIAAAMVNLCRCGTYNAIRAAVVSYGQLASRAMDLPVPAPDSVKLKVRSQLRWIGKPVQRLRRARQIDRQGDLWHRLPRGWHAARGRGGSSARGEITEFGYR